MINNYKIKLNKIFENNIILYSIKNRENKYLNPNWKKRLVPLTVPTVHFYSSLQEASAELKLVNESNKDKFVLITHYTITKDQLENIKIDLNERN